MARTEITSLSIAEQMQNQAELAALDAKIRALKEEIRRKANIAHKRLARLERNNLTELPAYQQWVKDGKVRFGVRGKNYNELQAELARVNRFLNSRTSLVREANKYLKEIAQMTGVKYKRVRELPDKLSNFFRISEKVGEYLRNVEGAASAIGYHKIWEVVNEVVETDRLDLGEVDELSDEMMDKIMELLDYSYAKDWMEKELDWDTLI